MGVRRVPGGARIVGTQASNGLGSSVSAAVDMTDMLDAELQALLDADQGTVMTDESFILEPDPFHAIAEAEAYDDSLIGIQRSEEWINARVKQLADEDFNKPASSKTRIAKDYFKITEIASLMESGDRRVLPHAAQEKYTDWINAHDLKRIQSFQKTYTPEEVYRKQIQEDNDILLKAEKKKIHDEQRETNRMTLTFIKSGFFCLMIPIIGMLPEPYCKFSPLAVLYVAYLNWPAWRKLDKMMKEIKAEKKKVAAEAKNTNYDPAV